MDYEIIWSERAMTGLREVVEAVARQNPASTQRLVNTIFHEVEEIARAPRKAKRYTLLQREEVREVRRNSYRLVYQIGQEKHRIAVLALTQTQHFEAEATNLHD